MACNVGLCVIGKMENDYALEFVEYYKKLGISNIILYDNNDLDGERFEDVIGDYINQGFVKLIDCRGFEEFQLTAYNHCIKNILKDFDWMCFFDFDEFLYLVDFDNINDFLSQEKFNDCDLVHVNWMVYDDNGLIENPTHRVVDVFKKPKYPFDFKKGMNVPENYHIKSIISNRGQRLEYTWNPHTPSQMALCKDCAGNYIDSSSPFSSNLNYDVAYIKHYTMKTISEYATKKVIRGLPDRNKEMVKKTLTIDNFFLLNEKTKEKVEWINKNLGISI